MRRIVLGFSVIMLAGAAGWCGLHWIPADFSYGMEAEFGTVPNDNQALAKWMRSQPGVYLAGENRERKDDRWRIEMIFGMTRNGWGEPPVPDLNSAAAALGYIQPDGPFRDVPR